MGTREARVGVSVHIGLNAVNPDHYRGWDGALQGCENDARDLAAIAQESDFDATLLLTNEATADAVIAALSEAAQKVRAGDLFWLSYSGHGSQVPDKNSDEADKLDETWVLYDRQLVDDELFDLWSKFEPGVRILVLSDSCHSGSAVRNTLDALRPEVLEHTMSVPPPNGMRTMPKALAREVYDAHQQEYDDIQTRVTAGDKCPVGASVLLLSGCQDNQTSADGAKNGLFTQTLLEVWNEGKFRGGHKKFWKDIVERMPPWQSPNWFTVGPEDPAFYRRKPFTI